ncbi:MAG: hypothetical protein NTV86_11115, partial [Planctomycetota bacterium]|nr:hypothetical protein [Planctomycetota bacterium]
VIRLAGGATDFGQALYACIWVALLALVAMLAVQMLRGAAWAPLELLLFWALLLGGALVVALHAVLWGTPAWFAVAYPVHPAAILAPVIAVSALCLTLLMQASAADSRLRYGSMVTLASAAAVVVAIVVIMVTQMDYYTKDLSAYSQTGMTDATRQAAARLLQGAGKVRLTCLYASSDKAKRSDFFRGDTWDLLQEIREANPKAVDIENVTTDAGKARVLARIRASLSSMNTERNQLLDETKRVLPELIKETEAIQAVWTAMPEESYVFNWGEGASIRDSLGGGVQALQDMQKKLQTQPFDKAMIDNAPLIEQVQDLLKTLQKVVTDNEAWLKAVAAVAEGAARQRGAILQTFAQAQTALQGARAALPGGTPTPEQARKALEAFAPEMRKAADALAKAADQLDDMAGEANRATVADCRLLGVPVQGFGIPFGELCRSLQVPGMLKLADTALEAAKQPQPDVYVQAVGNLAKVMAEVETQAASMGQFLDKRLGQVAAPAAPDKAFLDAAAKGEVFGALAKPLGDLMARLKALPEQKGRGIIDQLKEDNIVIVEAGDKVDVVGFDKVWPEVNDSSTAKDKDQDRPRLFDGDAAIRSYLIRLVHKEPFATVLLTYFEPRLPPQAQQMGQGNPPDDINVSGSNRGREVNDLSKLTERLELANFEVKKWNLVDPMPDEPAKAPLPGSNPATTPAPRSRILLVLPMLRQGPMALGPAQERLLKDKIDSGIPAIFLAHFVQPRPSMMARYLPAEKLGSPPLALSEYLINDWGVKPASDSWIVCGVPDPERPGLFQVATSLSYMSAVDFSADHAISKPLRGLRTLWQNLCPLMLKDTVLADTREELLSLPARSDPPGEVQSRRRELEERLARLERLEQKPLMTVPPAPGLWANNDLLALINEFKRQDGRLSPGKDDPRGPFTTAVLVVRKENPDKKTPAGQIVVMSTGLSLVDSYLAQPVPQVGEGGTFQPGPAPRIDAELVVNSAYWLSGRLHWISAPSRTEPMRAVAPAGMTWMWLLCVLGLPAAVLVAGGVVLYARSR